MERDKLKKEISKKPSGVFFIDGNKAFYFEQSLSGPIPLEIPADVFSDLELLNRKKLDALIKNFIVAQKLGPKNIIILLSTQLTYDKDFPRGSIEMEKNTEEFLELVPFEQTISKKALFAGKTKVIATNREFCDAVKATFINAGFIVSGIYPLSLCLELAPELQSSMDLNLVINKVPDLRDFNLMPVPEVAINSQEDGKPNKIRLYLMIGVMVLLGIFMVFLLYRNILTPQRQRKSNVLPTVMPVVKKVEKVTPASSSGVLESSASGEITITKIPTPSR
jgi:hypothetical protein